MQSEWSLISLSLNQSGLVTISINSIWRLDFPAGPMVKSLPLSAGDVSSVPGRETKIPHDAWTRKKKKKNQAGAGGGEKKSSWFLTRTF